MDITQYDDSDDQVERTFIGKWGRVAALALFGAVIFAAFSAVIVTAMTQHQITRNLDSNPDRVSFTDAYYILNGVNELKKSAAELESSIGETRGALESDTQLLRDIEAMLAEDLRTPLSVAQSARVKEICPGQFPETFNSEIMPNDVLLDRLERCKVNQSGFEALNVDPNIFGKIRGLNREMSAAKLRIENQEQKLKDDGAALVELEQKIASAKVFENDFSPQERLSKLLPGWLHWLFDVPPSIMPILLTFVSGIFGSLLVNLILIVYPSNKIGLYDGQRFLQHVILGGLIATAVYVVIGAGASVLSLSDTGASPDTYLTFSAIGIFAGMFSDRAARWLSENVPFDRTPKPNPGEDPVVTGAQPTG